MKPKQRENYSRYIPLTQRKEQVAGNKSRVRVRGSDAPYCGLKVKEQSKDERLSLGVRYKESMKRIQRRTMKEEQ